MRKFTVDAPKERGVKALEILGFQIVREKELGQSWVNTLKGKLWASSDKTPILRAWRTLHYNQSN